VALDASQGRMSARQRVVGIQRVIKRDRGPIARVVAGVAGRWKSRGYMGWIRSPIKVCLMTAETSRGNSGVVVVHMALHTRKSRVSPYQREDSCMVEGRRCPVCRRVAECAVGRKTRGDVCRIRGSCVVRLMAAIAVCRQSQVVIVYVALSASYRDMGAGQGE